ncbi:MAG: hypothetical protein SGI87_07400 [Flavobacteriales bacterium]|nr:hypothetical protein [Flavobacteriales bacterium]
MKTSVKFFALFLVVAVLAACAGGESETFAKVRVMQGDQVKALEEMTTTINDQVATIKSKIETMANLDSAAVAVMDSVSMATMQTDMANANAEYTRLNNLSSELETLKGEVASKMIPSAEEMAKGSENPFKDVTDQDLLTTFKAFQEKIDAMKSQVNSGM